MTGRLAEELLEEANEALEEAQHTIIELEQERDTLKDEVKETWASRERIQKLLDKTQEALGKPSKGEAKLCQQEVSGSPCYDLWVARQDAIGLKGQKKHYMDRAFKAERERREVPKVDDGVFLVAARLLEDHGDRLHSVVPDSGIAGRKEGCYKLAVYLRSLIKEEK
jgi:hypothetical protein